MEEINKNEREYIKTFLQADDFVEAIAKEVEKHATSFTALANDLHSTKACVAATASETQMWESRQAAVEQDIKSIWKYWEEIVLHLGTLESKATSREQPPTRPPGVDGAPAHDDAALTSPLRSAQHAPLSPAPAPQSFVRDPWVTSARRP